jgi:hypothetical protein
MDGAANPHDILKVLGEKRPRSLPGRRNPGGLPTPGCEASTTSTSRRSFGRCCGASGSGTWVTRASWPTSRSRSTSSSRRTIACWPRAGAGHRRVAAPRHHEGVAVDRVVHLRVVVPGDHEGAHRGRDQRQGGLPARPEGERDHGPADPGRHGSPELRSTSRSTWTGRVEFDDYPMEDGPIVVRTDLPPPVPASAVGDA